MVMRSLRFFGGVLSPPVIVNGVGDPSEPRHVFAPFQNELGGKVFHAIRWRIANGFQQFCGDEGRDVVVAAVEEPGDLLRGEPRLRLPQHGKESAFHVVHSLVAPRLF